MGEKNDKYRAAAKRIFEDEGTMEFDDKPVVSKSADKDADAGAYVQCWVWVSDQDAGL